MVQAVHYSDLHPLEYRCLLKLAHGSPHIRSFSLCRTVVLDLKRQADLLQKCLLSLQLTELALVPPPPFVCFIF